MTRLYRLILLLAGLCALAGPLLAAGAAGVPSPEADRDEVERARISQQRSLLRDELQAQEAACRDRFRVQHCLDEARTRHRQAQADLDRQVMLLDEAQRKQRAAARLERIQTKSSQGAEERARLARERAQASTARLEEARLRAARQRAAAASAPAAAVAPADAAAPATAASRPPGGPDERAEVARYKLKQERAQARKARAEERRRQREARGEGEQPLPTPR